MTTFFNRSLSDQEVIRAAYDFEIEAINNCDSTENPYKDIILAMLDGKDIWEGIEIAVEMAFAN